MDEEGAASKLPFGLFIFSKMPQIVVFDSPFFI